MLKKRRSGGSSSPQYAVNPHPQAQQYTGNYSPPPPPEPVDFSGLPRPIGVEYVSSLGSSSYSRESTPSNGSSHFMEGYRDFNGMMMMKVLLKGKLFMRARILFGIAHTTIAIYRQ